MAYARGEPVENPPESLRLFALSEGMKFAHLPSVGGLYDQHPQIIDDWLRIMQVKGEEQKKDRDRRERDMKSKKGN